MKKVLCIIAIILLLVCMLVSCNNGEATVTVNSDGYVVVNGVTTEILTDKDDIIIIDANGFVVVNGVKTEYEIKNIDSPADTTADSSTREIVKQEAIDGKLWITYKDDSDNPICIGKFDDSQMATEGLEYCLQNDGTYWIAVGSAKNIENIVVPSMHNGKAVTGIMCNAFSNCTNVKSVTLPNTIKTIDQYAFNHCGLLYIELPEGLETIENNAFAHCYRLAYANIPSSVVNVGEEVFYLCENLVELCNNTTYEFQTDRYNYQSPTPIKHIITDPKDSFLSVENDFIFFRDGIETILCGYIGHDTELILPTNETYSIHTNAFYKYDKITKIVIPSNVISIGDSAFQYCDNVTEIKIDVGVTSIENYAFWGLEEATITYSGTREQWQQITKFSQSINYNTDKPIPVYCCDDIE